MNLSEDERRLVAACFAQNDGNDFNWAEAAETVGIPRDEANDYATILADKGVFDGLTFGDTAVFTAVGRIIARRLGPPPPPKAALTWKDLAEIDSGKFKALLAGQPQAGEWSRLTDRQKAFFVAAYRSMNGSDKPVDWHNIASMVGITKDFAERLLRTFKDRGWVAFTKSPPTMTFTDEGHVIGDALLTDALRGQKSGVPRTSAPSDGAKPGPPKGVSGVSPRKVFISYSTKDATVVERLASKLKEIGHDVWLDKWKIKVGHSITAEIERGIGDADFVVLALSKHAVESRWVDREWKTKHWQQVKNNKRHILPILLEACNVPPLLQDLKYANFSNSFDAGLAELLLGLEPD